ncbi:hypothetical protein FPK15_contig00007-0001 [Flavobacterium psychrophilum]|nr:hypothetical protein FPK15_contig00007-0001 [Flavobacterium psychrophilum]
MSKFINATGISTLCIAFISNLTASPRPNSPFIYPKTLTPIFSFIVKIIYKKTNAKVI